MPGLWGAMARFGILSVSMVLSGWLSLTNVSAAGPEPNAQYSPDEVVEIVLSALADNDTPHSDTKSAPIIGQVPGQTALLQNGFPDQDSPSQ